jgi:outer membrane immunogenic protein
MTVQVRDACGFDFRGGTMRNLLGIAGLTSLLIAAPLSAASAADMGMPLKAPPPPPPAVSWTGCYIDGGGGYGLWNQEHSTSTTFAGVPGTTISQTDGGRGWLGRLGAGCDYQVAPRWVIGVLGDYDFMDLHGTNSPLEVTGGAPFFPILTAREKESDAWYAGARIGYLVTPSVLTYVDGGWTGTHFDSQTLVTNLGAPTGVGYPAHTYNNGWFVGGGTETSLAGFLGGFLPNLPNGLFWRSEYRYASYNRTDLPEISLATGIPDGNVEHTRPYVQTVTSGIVWRFNWSGPIATRY